MIRVTPGSLQGLLLPYDNSNITIAVSLTEPTSPSLLIHTNRFARSDPTRAEDTLHCVSLSAYLCTLNDHHLPVVLIAVEQLS